MKYLLTAILSLSFIGQSISQPPPDFTLVDQDSVSWNLYTELGKGNTVLLDFFFASCVPCQTFTPEIEQIYQDYGAGTGTLIVLGISDRDNNATLAAFDSTYGVTYPSGGTEGNGNTITNLYMTWFPFFSWPNYAVICSDTSIFWGVPPDTGMPELRNKIDTCDIVTDIDELNSDQGKTIVYPNPSYGYVNIAISSTQERFVWVKLYDLQGALVKQSNIRMVGSMAWDLSDIQTGYYLMELSDGGKVYSREKILLLH